jgi:hypothetical protein
MESVMEKFLDGKGNVAVLVSPGFGAGWSTWANKGQEETLMFHPKLVQACLDGVVDIRPTLEEIFGVDIPYNGGWRGVGIVWLPVGTKFIIREYDGSESVQRMEYQAWVTA